MTSCQNRPKGPIMIGIYSFTFPKEFDLIKENGIDSYVGKIANKSISLDFDYGYYSNKLISSPEEYIESKLWLNQFIDNCNMETPAERQVSISDISIVDIRKANFSDNLHDSQSDYIAILKWLKGEQFEYPIQIPEDLKSYAIKIDTIQGCMRKIVLAKDPSKGITGIYLQNLNAFNESINSFPALSMSTSHLSKGQQDTLLEIFNTIKINSTK